MIQEVSQLARSIADSNAYDLEQQKCNLDGLVQVRSLLGRGEAHDLAGCLDVATELTQCLAKAEQLDPERMLDMVTRLVSRVEAAFMDAGMNPRKAVEVQLKSTPESTANLKLSQPSRGGNKVPLKHVAPTPTPIRGSEPHDAFNPYARPVDPPDKDGIARSLNGMCLGELLVQTGAVTDQQVDVAMKKRKQGQRVGEVLIALGFVTVEQIREAAELQGHLRIFADETQEPKVYGKEEQDDAAGVTQWRQSLLGEILVRTQAITQEQLDEGLKVRRATGLRIGEALVHTQACTWPVLRRAIRIQEKMRYEARGLQ